jgi:endonuclease/exonuclease/phosphatase family metal-dependent hydrolase
MNHTRKGISLVAAGVMACTALMFASAAARAEEQTVKVVSHNLGSNADSDLNGNGLYAGHGSVEYPITRVVSRIKAENPHAATLQEVCEVDVARMLAQLGAPWVASQFVPTQPAKPYPSPDGYNNSCEDQRHISTGKGNVILTRMPIWPGEDIVVELIPTSVSLNNQYKGRYHRMGCINIVKGGVMGGRMQICNLHLTAGDTAADLAQRESQAIQARNYLNGIEHQLPVVVAGDFNSEPKTYVIDQFHRVNRAGTAWTLDDLFYEGDHATTSAFGYFRGGAPTHGVNGTNAKKLDYVFFGKTYTKLPSSVDLYTNFSDTSYHEVITAKTIFQW